MAGRIADLVPGSELGALMPVGTVVAEVESGQRLKAVLQLAASDGPRVRADMTGSVVVRGLADQSYPVRLHEDPLVQDREDGSSTLTALAAIEADARGELFKGLTGFARIEAGERRFRIEAEVPWPRKSLAGQALHLELGFGNEPLWRHAVFLFERLHLAFARAQQLARRAALD